MTYRTTVTSVAGRTGAITLGLSDVTDLQADITGLLADDAATTKFTAEYYGATGNGTLRTVASVLGVVTYNAVVGYQNAAGDHPYAWLANRPFGNNFALLTQNTSTTTVLSFTVTMTTTALAAAANSNTFLQFTPALHNNLKIGTPVSGPGIRPGAVIVEWNDATGQMMLSGAHTTDVASGATITFGVLPANLAVGMSVFGPSMNFNGDPVNYVPANTTISAINSGTGQITVSAALSSVPPIGTEFTFWSRYTDNQIANASIDWLGIQSAIQYAIPTGGTVRLKAATYVTSAPIVLPQCKNDDASGKAVNLVGAAAMATIISPASDFGYGQAVISCDDPTGSHWNARGRYSATTGANFGLLSNLTLLGGSGGAKGESPYLNSKPLQMAGLNWGARRQLDNIYVYGFMWGIDIVGDHTSWNNILCGINFGSLYFGPVSAYAQGDLIWHNIAAQGARLADIFVNKDSYMNFICDKLYTGGGPYAMYFQAGMYEAWNAFPYNFGAGTSIDDWQSEFMGNGFIIDGNARTPDGNFNGTRNIILNEMKIGRCFQNFDTAGGNNSLLTGGQGRFAYIDVKCMNGNYIRDWVFGAWHYDAGMFCAINSPISGAGPGGNYLGGGVLNSIESFETNNRPFIGQKDGSNVNILDGNIAHWTWEKPGNFTGTFTNVPLSAALPQGSLIEQPGPYVGVVAGSGKPVMGVTANPITDPTAWSSDNGFGNGMALAVIYNGRGVQVHTSTVNTGAVMSFLKSGTAGAAAIASSSTDGIVIGHTTNNGAGTSPNFHVEARIIL